jgi:hypothetical protein
MYRDRDGGGVAGGAFERNYAQSSREWTRSSHFLLFRSNTTLAASIAATPRISQVFQQGLRMPIVRRRAPNTYVAQKLSIDKE